MTGLEISDKELIDGASNFSEHSQSSAIGATETARILEALKNLRLGNPVYFIVGARRSGTTWLQSLLSQNSAVATVPETLLFSRYLHRIATPWNMEERLRKDHSDKTGIQSLISRGDFDLALRVLGYIVIGRIGEKRPQSECIVEKSPSHVFHADLIQRVFPSAHFIHLVRDPRDVTRSMVDATKTWGRHWRALGPIDAAREWRQSVEYGWAIASETDRYYELKYERLLSAPGDELRRLFGWMEINVSEKQCESFVNACLASKMREGEGDGSGVIPTGKVQEFIRERPASDWQQTLPKSWIRSIEWVAGDALTRAGYEPMFAPKRKPSRVWAKEQLERVQWRTSATLSALAKRL